MFRTFPHCLKFVPICLGLAGLSTGSSDPLPSCIFRVIRVIIFYSLKDCSGMQWYAVVCSGWMWCQVAFHNHKHSRFLKLESITRSNFAECPPDPNVFPQPTEQTITEIDVLVTDTVDSNAVPASALPSSWTSAMFEVKSPGWGAEVRKCAKVCESANRHESYIALLTSFSGLWLWFVTYSDTRYILVGLVSN